MENFVYSSLDEENEDVFEDAVDMADKGSGNTDFNPEVSPNMRDDYWGVCFWGRTSLP